MRPEIGGKKRALAARRHLGHNPEAAMIDWVDAINGRSLVSFHYEGLERVVIPVAFGRNSNTGHDLVRGYQVGGLDAKRAIPIWSMFRVDKVVGGVILEEHFDDDPPNYRRNDRGMDTVYAQL